MIKYFLISVLTINFANATIADDAKVIYGEDNRVYAHETSNELFKKLARSTAAMIPNSSIESAYGGLLFKVTGDALKESMGVCEDQRYAEASTAAMCSGFLVGDDLLVTAGHCVTNQQACDSNKWVFDFDHESAVDSNTTMVDKSSVYNCVEVIHQELDNGSMMDFALVRLDRKVVGKSPLKYRTTGKIEDGQEIVVIGHPSGLPSIIADGAQVRKNDSDVFFSANLDTFGGNSGSAVFNAETGVVEGILVRGARDYVYDMEKGCYKVNECENDACRGEDVTRITNIPELMPKAPVMATVDR